MFVVFISEDEVREHFLDFVCDETVFIFMKQFVVIHNGSKSVKCGKVRCS